MNEDQTTAAIQRCLDALQAGTTPEPLIRDLLERAVRRLRVLCGSLLHRSYPRLTQPPLNLETDELLDGVVGGLLNALRTVRPQTARQFFALANQHMRWQLNDLARLLDERPRAAALAESGIVAPLSSDSCLSQEAHRMLQAIEGLPEAEREVFELIRIQGLTYAEVAGIIEASVATVRRRLNRARLLLAEQLADLHPDTPGEPTETPGDTPSS
jgi:RNA polymerase sigma-70 factor (ECF subfamily)